MIKDNQQYFNKLHVLIDALVIIGGDGSLTGARIFAQEFDVPCIGLPGTIDNDLYGSLFRCIFCCIMRSICTRPSACRGDGWSFPTL